MNKKIKTVWKIFAGRFPVQATKIAYFKTKHERLNLRKPKLFDEKMEYLKLYQYADDPLVVKCADKYEVRSYVEEKGLAHILNELYGVWNTPEEVPFSSLPEQYAIKCTHGCHMNIICTKEGEIDPDIAKEQLTGWLKEEQWRDQQSLHYRHIKPRIICEKYLQSKAGGVLPPDYKIYCFNGVPKLVLIISNRDKEMELTFRDLDWNILEIGNRRINKMIPRPEHFNEMIEYSKTLSAPFPFVRVDFYEIDGRIIFGELTFTPAGCNADYYTKEGQIMLGDMLEIN